MPYSELQDRLADGFDRPDSVVTLPDGSVDAYYDVYRGRSTPVASRADLAAFVAEGETSSLRMREQNREAGGQAVNAARQGHALDVPVTCYGHLDAPAFDELPFESWSMGTPAFVRVFDLLDDNLMLCEESPDLDDWSFERLAGVDDAISTLESADAICLMNWVSSRNASAAYRELATLDLADPVVVVDPGDVTGCDDAELDALADALGVLADAARVVLSTNAGETRRVAETIGEGTRSTPDRVRSLRDTLGVHAVVAHERERAVAASADGVVQVPNVDAPTVVRRTGGGDRFGAALAVAVAADFEWSVALAFANACASYFVSTAETASVDALRAFLDEVTLPD